MKAATPKLHPELSVVGKEEAWTKVKSKKARRIERGDQALQPLQTCYPEGVNAVGGDEEWEEIEFAVDSGATETVVSENMLSSIDTKESWGSKQGVTYKVANGTKIPNEGEKVFCAVTDGGIGRKVKAQVCEVDLALMSVRKIVDHGNTVVFGKQSYIQDDTTGQRIPLVEKGGMFMLKLWVKKDF